MRRVVLDGLPLQVRSAGIAVYTDQLVRSLAALRPDVELVLLGLRGLARAALDETWPPNVRRLDSIAYPLVMGYPPINVPRLLTLERIAGAADLFHATNYACPRAERTPMVVTVHDLTLLRRPELGTPALRRLVGRVRDSARAARLVIADSESTRRDLVELAGVDSGKVRVVALAPDPGLGPMDAATARERVQRSFAIAGPYLLHVGTIEPRKNLPVLIRAYARLRRERGIGHALVLAGGLGWGHREPLDLIGELGLAEHVRVPGRVSADDLRALYGAADLFVSPSLYEGFGLTLLEAMASGVPAVAASAGSLPEVAGAAAVLVEPRDEQALADAIARVLGDPALADAMRARGRARARLFSWERCGRETLQVYEEATAARPALGR
jgi:glycosyltransferase involved in cell wall biosynthesis